MRKSCKLLISQAARILANDSLLRIKRELSDLMKRCA